MMPLAIEIADFIFEHYPEMDAENYGEMVNFIANVDHLHVERNDGKIILVAIYFMINDTALGRIVADNKYHEDKQFLIDCMKQKGQNAHVYMAVHHGDQASMIRAVKAAIVYHNPKTLSWYNPDMSKFHIYRTRRTVCLTQ